MAMDKSKAREVADVIEFHDELWTQESWISTHDDSVLAEDMRKMLDALKNDQEPDKNICGSRGCVAGWTAILNAPAGTLLSGWNVGITLPVNFAYKGRRTVDIDVFARDMLGLDDFQAGWLFAGVRSKEQVLWALRNEDGNWDQNDAPYNPAEDDDYDDYDYDDYEEDASV